MLIICRLILVFAICLPVNGVFAQHNIIPAPVIFQPQSGSFILNNDISIVPNAPEIEPLKIWFSETLAARGLVIGKGNDVQSGNFIMIGIFPERKSELGDEGYILRVTGVQIVISAHPITA